MCLEWRDIYILMMVARYSSVICLTSWRQNGAENLKQEEGVIIAFDKKSNEQLQNLFFSEFFTYLTSGQSWCSNGDNYKAVTPCCQCRWREKS
jgi:hypothetical protein